MQPSPERTFQCSQKFSQKELHPTHSDGASTSREAQPIQTCSPVPPIIRGIEVEYVRAIGCIQDGGWGVHLERSGGKFRACEINGSTIGGYFPRRVHDLQPNHWIFAVPREPTIEPCYRVSAWTSLVSVLLGVFLVRLKNPKIQVRFNQF
jgi:hypothetical protein